MDAPGTGRGQSRTRHLNPQPAAVQLLEYPATAGRVEHVTIGGEPDPGDAPAKPPHRITLRRYALASPLHGCVTELAILEGNYLGVRCIRPNAEPRRYQFDLRFANPVPERIRGVPWVWLASAVALTALGGGTLAHAWIAGHAVLSQGVIGGILATSLGVTAVYRALRRTTESLHFRSVHGNATLVAITGGVGSTNRDQAFFSEITRCIEAARIERAQAPRQFLCDEMREHYRLHQLGILGDSEYESSKARILAAH